VNQLGYLCAAALFILALNWMNAGMPIIAADKARAVLAIKRGQGPGFAGIENDLYFTDHTWMLFGDAKEIVGELVKQLAPASGTTRARAA
jgi:NAD/NADP transhydrogenase beta subunit